MIPAGYMAKRVQTRPDLNQVAGVEDIFSLSNCISHAFADYVGFWRHNGFWLFDSVRELESLARDEGVDLSGTTMFYYEVFEKEYDENTRTWSGVSPNDSLRTDVELPDDARLAGYDVTTFFAGSTPECSPLSCNAVAREVSVNRHCLFESFERASSALEAGKLDLSEPGAFRIFAVYTV